MSVIRINKETRDIIKNDILKYVKRHKKIEPQKIWNWARKKYNEVPTDDIKLLALSLASDGKLNITKDWKYEIGDGKGWD